MISVERVLDYTKLPSEAPLEAEEEKRPPPDWPQNGQISTSEACLKYSKDGPLVLKDLSFTIKAREKVHCNKIFCGFWVIINKVKKFTILVGPLSTIQPFSHPLTFNFPWSFGYIRKLVFGSPFGKLFHS